MYANKSEWERLLSDVSHDFYHLYDYNILEAERIQGYANFFYHYDSGKLCLIPFIKRKIIPNNNLDLCNFNLFDVTSAYGYPTPLFNKKAWNDLTFKRTALNIWIDQLKNEHVCSIFIRFHPLFQIDTSLWNDFGELVYHGETVTIHLNQEPDMLWRDTRKDHKRDIKRWIKNGGEIFKDDNFKHYDKFQKLYLRNMIKLNASSDYFFSSQYFEGLKKALRTKLHLFFATLNGRLISGALFTDTGGILQYHLSGTDPNFVNFHPSKPILHFVRLWGNEKGLNVFHLGGGVGAEHSGLFEFKAGFSKARNQFHTWRCVLEENIYRKLVSQKQELKGLISNDEINTKGYFPAYRRPSN